MAADKSSASGVCMCTYLMFDVFHAHTIDCTLKTPYRSPRTGVWGKGCGPLGARLAVCSAQCTLSWVVRMSSSFTSSQPDRFLISNLSACAVCGALRCSRLCAALRWWCLMQPAPARRVVCLCLFVRLLLLSSLTTIYLIFSSSCLPACLSHPPSPPHVYVHARHTAAAPFHAISAASSLAYPPLPLSRPNSLSIANPRRNRPRCPSVHAILARVPHFSPLLLEHRSLLALPGLTLHTSAARLACRLVHINPRPPRRSALLPPSSAATWKKP